MSGVARSANQRRAPVRDARGDRESLGRELLVALAGHREYRNADLAQTLTEPRLRAGARETQRGGESRAISTTRLWLGRRGEGGEEGLGEPLEKKLVRAHLLDVSREVVVASTARGALARIANAPRGAEHYETAHGTRVGECHVQGHPGAKGVSAQVHRLVAEGPGDEVSGLVQGGAHVARAAVTGQVECPDLAATCQNGAVLVGRGSCLREAVEPHEGRARALALDGEE